jgi:hypothetical protein
MCLQCPTAYAVLFSVSSSFTLGNPNPNPTQSFFLLTLVKVLTLKLGEKDDERIHA